MKKLFIAIGLAVVVAAGVKASQLFAEQAPTVQTTQPQSPAPESKEVTDLKNQITDLKNELLDAKFKLAIKMFWNVDQVVRYEQNLNKFYFISQDSTGDSIWVYDATKDSSYQKTGTINPVEGMTQLYTEKLAKDMEFRPVGMDGNKFVFVKTGYEDSPGPCSSYFVGNQQLYSLNTNNINPLKQVYTTSQNKLKKVNSEIKQCEIELSIHN